MHELCLVGYILCLVGYILCLVGYILCLVGYILCLVGYILCLVGYILPCCICAQGDRVLTSGNETLHIIRRIY